MPSDGTSTSTGTPSNTKSSSRTGPSRPPGADLSAPMPGSVTQVLVRAGDAVTPGQPLVIIEAMKMEHVIRAPRVGRVHAVHIRPGDQVEGGATLVDLAPEPPEAP